MNVLKGSVLALCLSATLPMSNAAFAETAAPAAKTDTPKTDAAKPDAAKPDADDKMSEADKRAKAIDCSKQADAKKLHGEARKKFREACKHGK